jgi:hypothetical protein|tara:strand:+ start:2703 stop:3302 length:600 start_codon:yes stop_codon:yes gene_type:complete
MKTAFIILCLLVATHSMGRPISYVGGQTIMANSGPQSDGVYWHYTPNINYSLGLDYQRDKISDESFSSARLTYLINRKNTAKSQRNLYLKTGVGLNDSDNHFYALTGDWETRRVFAGFSATQTSGIGYDMFEQTLKVGIAPYLGAYGDFHTWLMVETKKNDMDDDRITYPVLRFFKGGALMEVGYHKKTDWNLHLMYRF